jgi:AcrR family transcriptional regulator
MSWMSTAYEEHGRVDQKRRTRSALVAAAHEIVARGSTPTVEEAAEMASVSRATAYRYFPNQHALLAAAHPETGVVSLLPDEPPADVAARVDLVVGELIRTNLQNEAQQRTMLRLSLDVDAAARAGLPLRQGRAIPWIEEALEPLRGEVPGAALHRLALAIRSATGIEALVWLLDVAGVSAVEAEELMRWSAQAMLAAARRDPAV